MEILHNEFLPEPDDNQTLSSRNVKSEVEIAEASELISMTKAEKATPSANVPPRKVHSASPPSNGYGIDDFLDEIPRPFTSAGTDSIRSDVPRHRKKKSAAVLKNTARDNKTPRQERPRSAGVNEWGDFDTDRLLRDDLEDLPVSNQIPPELQDGQRARSRKSRRSTPATSSPRPNPWEGYLTLNSESKEQPTRQHLQVLRQKTVDILTLDLAQSSQPSGRASATPKPLQGKTSFQKSMSPSSRPVTSHASRPATATPLFGMEVPNTTKNRLAIFARFGSLWSLIPRSSEASPVDQFAASEGSDTEANPFAADIRSPFECRMTMVKICKTVGISLPASAATRLSFWHTNDQGVDFTAFCDLVIQGAIQPAFHHFNLDNSLGEYVSALDTAMQSLMTTEPARRSREKVVSSEFPYRLKELNEIQPVFMSWKAGITPRLVQSDENSAPPPPRALITAEKVRRALEASTSQHMLAHQLPIEEARVTHVANIRRKVQLHKSWKFSTETGTPLAKGKSNLSGQVSRLPSSHDRYMSQGTELAEMLDRARTVFPTSAGADDALPQGHLDLLSHSVEVTSATPEMQVETKNDEVLVCCSCSIRCAELWCSSCFTVNCQKCWQEIHSCTVDMSMVSSSTGKSLLGPTALAIRQKRSDQGPPVPMVYLPTKSMAAGALAKGNCIVRHKSGKQKSSNQVLSGVTRSFVANAILPSLRKSHSTGTVIRHYERPQVETIASPSTDSTADLVKSLMMRMTPSSTPATGTRTTASIESAMKMHKSHQPPRPKLHLAPVSLDAEFMLP